MWDFDIFDETWRLKDTIYKTSAEAQAAIEQMNREYWTLAYEERLDSKIPTVMGHTEIVRDLLKAREDVQPE